MKSVGDVKLSEDDCKWLRNSRQILLDIGMSGNCVSLFHTSYMILYAGRTFPTHCHYVGETKQKLSLFRVLTMYAKFNASVGYCQGS